MVESCGGMDRNMLHPVALAEHSKKSCNEKKDSIVGEFKSPGSLMGSSVNSQQLSSFEIDEVDSEGGASWRIGMPWLKKESSNASVGPVGADVGESSSVLEDQRYYGGLMKQATEGGTNAARSPSKLVHSTTHSRARPKRKIRIGLSTDDESVSDFDESEWTPQDSAYGAACPVCGCISKHVRRLIEFSLLAGMALGFVYLLVTTSIQINNDRIAAKTQNSTATSEYHGGQLALDDDLYVEYNQNLDDDEQYAPVDDYSIQYDENGGDDGGNQNDDTGYNNANDDVY